MAAARMGACRSSIDTGNTSHEVVSEKDNGQYDAIAKGLLDGDGRYPLLAE